MTSFISHTSIDCGNAYELSEWWKELLGYVDVDGDPNLSGHEECMIRDPATDHRVLFIEVPEAKEAKNRIHLDLRPRDLTQAEEVERLLGLGARHLDIGQGDVPWVVLADPEGNPCCVMEDRAVYADTGPLAALRLDSAKPDRDAEFWSWLTGWTDSVGVAPRSLRHPSRRGPLLELCPETAPKGATKNRLHLDVRLDDADDADDVAAGIAERGGKEVHHPDWGSLPWRLYTDPSGNELCVLPARS